VQAGTELLPAITTTGDTNTGIWFPAADTIAFTEGGVESMRMTSAGEVLVGGTTNISTNSGCLNIERNNTNPILSFFRNDTTISSGNTLGSIRFYGNDTTSNTPTQLAYIEAPASGTHAAGDNPTDLVFGTTADGSDTVAERMRIDSSGNLLVGTTSNASTQGAPLQVITAIAARRNIANSGGPAFRMEKSRATTDGTYTIVANGDTLGDYQFFGADGAQYIIGASV